MTSHNNTTVGHTGPIGPTGARYTGGLTGPVNPQWQSMSLVRWPRPSDDLNRWPYKISIPYDHTKDAELWCTERHGQVDKSWTWVSNHEFRFKTQEDAVEFQLVWA